MKSDLKNITVLVKFSPPPLISEHLCWTGSLLQLRHQNHFVGQVKLRGGELNLTTTVILKKSFWFQILLLSVHRSKKKTFFFSEILKKVKDQRKTAKNGLIVLDLLSHHAL